ncbi:MAG: YcgN family cysteine cluster protein [Cocleimonas sp.]
MSNTKPFWQSKSLTEMNRDEWESLCDHCGKCCLLKLQDDEDDDEKSSTQSHADSFTQKDTDGSVYYTNVVCDLFDKDDGHCTDYWNREERVPTCIRLTQDNLADLAWMPPSCSYKRVMEGRGLAKWHHLITGDKNTIHEKNQSVLGRVVFENEVDEDDLEEHIVTWPLK